MMTVMDVKKTIGQTLARGGWRQEKRVIMRWK
jgi:hypothetical protein